MSLSRPLLTAFVTLLVTIGPVETAAIFGMLTAGVHRPNGPFGVNGGTIVSEDGTWMGRRIDDMTREEMAAALKMSVRLLRISSASSLLRPEVRVSQSPTKTVVGRTFKWAFIAAGHLWTEGDHLAMQSRLDAFASTHGLSGAVLHFGEDSLDVEVPYALDVEQVVALHEWLETEREALDVSQVP